MSETLALTGPSSRELVLAISWHDSTSSIVMQIPMDSSLNFTLLTRAKFLSLTMCQMGFLLHSISAKWQPRMGIGKVMISRFHYESRLSKAHWRPET